MGLMGINYDGLPEALREGARNWIEHGVPPGHFLTAVVKNDLTEAFSRADDTNTLRMQDIVKWWYNEAPWSCWGSVENFEKWKERHGRKSDG